MTTSFTAPLRFRTGHTAKNRVALAPMTNQQSHADGRLSDDEFKWLMARAKGGFGVVFTCASHVAKDGQGWPGELGCFSDAHVAGLKRVADGVRSHGALSILQIFHGGSRADATVNEAVPWSAVAGEGVRAATEEDVVRVVAEFADAAGRAKDAGFDGVEVHGAHGYLLTQFLSRENTRSDRWGGEALENRARLLRETLRAVRARVGAGFVVGVRLSPEDFGNAKGMDLDESLQTARFCVDDGVDFVHVSLWNAHENTKKRPAEHALPSFKALLPQDVPLLTAGSIWTADDATAVMARGADMIALGRVAILNPGWASQAVDVSWQPVRPPVTRQYLKDVAVSDTFASYMGKWRGFVSD